MWGGVQACSVCREGSHSECSLERTVGWLVEGRMAGGLGQGCPSGHCWLSGALQLARPLERLPVEVVSGRGFRWWIERWAINVCG